ncbi:MAG TPA: hypothetical protein VK530_08975 [Candidatus Acidoferrum sp.]|nr:hypothetical protein [Candidatus Acidoferrum sp.]
MPAVLREFDVPIHRKDIDFQVTARTVQTMVGYMDQPQARA